MIAPADIDIHFSLQFPFNFCHQDTWQSDKQMCHKMLLFNGSFLLSIAQKPKSRRVIYNFYFVVGKCKFSMILKRLLVLNLMYTSKNLYQIKIFWSADWGNSYRSKFDLQIGKVFNHQIKGVPADRTFFSGPNLEN